MRWLSGSLILGAVVVAAALLTPTAGAVKTACPSGGTPAPGSTINGGLEVDGFQCKLTNVTVNGGITVDGIGTGTLALGYLVLNGSTVNGGIVVKGGGLDVGDDDFFTFNRTHNPSRINGGVKLDHPLTFALADATINGGVTVDGVRDLAPFFGCGGDPGCFINSFMCGNDVNGKVTVKNVSNAQIFVGDPGEVFYSNGADCDSNTIHGSVFLKNSNFINPFSGESNEIEGDSVTGSVHVDGSTAEVYGNTIGGSLLCTNGSVIQPPAAGDPSGSTNTVGGANTCF